MVKFLTRKRDKQAFPVESKGKTYRRNYNSNPSFFTKNQIHSDAKATHRNDDPLEPQDHGKEHDIYKRKLLYESDKQYLKEEKKSHKKQKRAFKKEEKQQKKVQKSEIEVQEKQAVVEAKREYQEGQQDEAEERETIERFEGNRE
ncbi:MAG: hypothetical protein KAJ44_00780 [Thermoplasmatales archaeon]|nr:hypothetical protein [Thermoplasmatales archaeon]